jgi:uncharacterized DUF497 family protein
MEFEWDNKKNRENRIKHGVSFEQAIAIWDSVHLEVEEIARSEDGESRSATIGWIGEMLYLAVWTARGGKIRLISVRRARKDEERVFAKKIQDRDGDG